MVSELIPPDEVIDKIICHNCGLEYSKNHYDVLLENKKLAYFEIIHVYYDTSQSFRPDCICHGCLFNLLKNASKTSDTKIKIKLIYKGAEHYLSYDPEDPNSLW